MKLLRTFAFPLCLALAPLAAATVSSDANASVMIAVPFDSLVKDADAVAIIAPLESKSVWEDGRIYTYTRVKVEQGVAGDTSSNGGSDVWVRTMGGVVGKVGQLVDGEPVFTPNKSNLVFLRKFKAGGTWEVSARAQGQYPVIVDELSKKRRIVRSANVGVLLPPKRLQQDSAAAGAVQPGPVAPQSADGQKPAGEVIADISKIRLAGDVLHDKPLDEATKEIASTWKRLHPQNAAK
jgi:hypothetical protein